MLNSPAAKREAFVGCIAAGTCNPPGLPLPVKEHARFITEDCIQVSVPPCRTVIHSAIPQHPKKSGTPTSNREDQSTQLVRQATVDAHETRMNLYDSSIDIGLNDL